jgi:hypothetical protein
MAESNVGAEVIVPFTLDEIRLLLWLVIDEDQDQMFSDLVGHSRVGRADVKQLRAKLEGLVRMMGGANTGRQGGTPVRQTSPGQESSDAPPG